MKGRSKILHEHAEEQRKRCRDWLLTLMRDGQPKSATKAELMAHAIQDLGISQTSFNMAWIWAIEDTGRHDWYEPVRRKAPIRQ